MAQSIASIQRRSDEKRGVAAKTYKLSRATIALIAELAESTGKPQAAIIAEAIAKYASLPDLSKSTRGV
ncbi:ribbon-helix-helix protein, CopG family [Salmonella enterica subsp. enterica serovar Yaba]|nr:ribbon-helix-helix protein, CopG family [Salmonella enterica subsp. enterica serovar Yaba]